MRATSAFATLIGSVALFALQSDCIARNSERDRPHVNRAFRSELARAVAGNEAEVTLVIAARRGSHRPLAEHLQRLGAALLYEAEAVEYFRVRVSPAVAMQIAESPLVSAVDVNYVVRDGYDMPYFNDGTVEGRVRQRAARAIEIGDQDFLEVIGAAQWRKKHPIWDGRGVTIAHVENAPDFLSPVLGTGLARDGSAIGKFAGVHTVLPIEETKGSTSIWLKTWNEVEARGGFIEWQERRMAAPYDGAFAVAVLDRASLNAAVRKIIETQYGQTDVLVLLDRGARRVWIAPASSGALSRGVADYAVAHEIGVLGNDDPKTRLRESVGYAVQMSGSGHVALIFGLGNHNTFVTAAAAARAEAPGDVEGVAPGARIISIDMGVSSVAGMIEGVIHGFLETDADIVLLEQATAPVDYRFPERAGDSVASIVYSRLVAATGKPLVVPAGNNTGASTVGESSIAEGVLAVGAYQSAKSYALMHEITLTNEHNLYGVGAGGPARNGRLKPDILAPSGFIAAAPGFLLPETETGLALPPGYQIASGTSAAAPVAAGSLALLMSAAKLSGRQYSLSSIRRALFEGAMHLPNIPEYEQGNGLIQVERAWELLSSLPPAMNYSVDVEAPIETATSHLLPHPHRGYGLINHSWPFGRSGTQNIFIRRDEGPDTVRVKISVRGGRGVFSAPRTLDLAKGKPAALPVTISPQSYGVHSATIIVRDSESFRVVARIPCQVFVPRSVRDTPVDMRLEVAYPARTVEALRVDSDLQAMVIEFGPTTRIVGAGLERPDGRQFAPYPFLGKESTRLIVERPQAGAWKIEMSRGVAPVEGSEIVYFKPIIAGPQHGTEQPPRSMVDVRVTPIRGDITPRVGGKTTATVRGHTSGTVRAATGTMSRFETRLDGRRIASFDIEVPANTELLLIKQFLAPVGAAATSTADTFLFDCTGPRCMPKTNILFRGSEDLAFIHKPRPGRWVLTADHVDGSADATAVELLIATVSSTRPLAHVDEGVRMEFKCERGEISVLSVEIEERLSTLLPLEPDRSNVVLDWERC